MILHYIMYIHVFRCVYVCVYNIYIYIYICICVERERERCIYIYRERERNIYIYTRRYRYPEGSRPGAEDRPPSS